MRLKEFKYWLKNCHYPDNGINQSFYNAKLQGPDPSEDTLKNIPFITTYYENIDDKKVIKKICSKLWNIQSGHRSKVFKNSSFTKATEKLTPIINTLVEQLHCRSFF